MSKSQTPHTHVALNAPKQVAPFLAFGQNVHDQLAANTTLFPSVPVALVQFASELSDLSAKQTVALTKVPGSVAARNASHRQALLTLNAYRAYVEQVANADPTNAEEIAKKAGMSVRKTTTHPKSDLAVKHVAVGEVHLVAKGIKGTRAHQWQTSADGKTWTDLPPTAQATAHVTGLSPGSTVYFRHRVILKTGAADWSQPVSAIIT